MKIILTISLIAAGLIVGCSNSKQVSPKLDEHELLYANTSDSLQKYRSEHYISENLFKDSVVRDYVDLDFTTFKRKYRLNNDEMFQLAQSLELSYQILATYAAIGTNTQRAENTNAENIHRLDSISEYSFQKVMPFAIDTNRQDAGDSLIYEIMMNASDVDLDSLR
jgi:hypothetical protein